MTSPARDFAAERRWLLSLPLSPETDRAQDAWESDPEVQAWHATQTEALSTPPRLGIYRHFKGGIYQVFGTVRDANYDARVTVLYAPLAPNGLPGERWVRTVEHFNSMVRVDDADVPRYEYLGSSITPDIQCALRSRHQTLSAAASE